VLYVNNPCSNLGDGSETRKRMESYAWNRCGNRMMLNDKIVFIVLRHRILTSWFRETHVLKGGMAG
jgi:hypothetical protein